MQYHVFDVLSTQQLVLEERLAYLVQIAGSLPPHVTLMSFTTCQNEQQITRLYDQSIRNGHNGLLVRKPSSYYCSGYSNTLFRLRVGVVSR